MMMILSSIPGMVFLEGETELVLQAWAGGGCRGRHAAHVALLAAALAALQAHHCTGDMSSISLILL